MQRLLKTLPLILLLLLVTSVPALAALRVDRYVPERADPGARVRIEGRDFGSRKPQHTIRYGTLGTPVGTATIRSWSETAIEVDLPRAITPGLYWLAVYEREVLRSNQLRALAVGGGEAGPGRGAFGGLTDKLRTTIPSRGVPTPGTERLKGVPLQSRLSLNQIGTSWVQKFRENTDFYCGVRTSAIGGHLSDPGGGGVLVGYSNYHDPGKGPAPCWTKNNLTYRGMVRFSMNLPPDAPVESAVLSFRVAPVTGNDGDSGCDRQPIVNLIPLRESWSSGMQEDHAAAQTAVYQIGSLSGGRVSRDITRLVRQWQADGAANHGFALQGRSEQYGSNNKRCVVTATDFKLVITTGHVQ